MEVRLTVVVGKVVTECSSWSEAFELLDGQYVDYDQLMSWGLSLDGSQPVGFCFAGGIWWALCNGAEKFEAYVRMHIDVDLSVEH